METEPSLLLKAPLLQTSNFEPQIKRIRTEGLIGYTPADASLSSQGTHQQFTGIQQDQRLFSMSQEKARKDEEFCDITCESFKHLCTRGLGLSGPLTKLEEKSEFCSSNTSENNSMSIHDVNPTCSRTTTDSVFNSQMGQVGPADRNVGGCYQGSAGNFKGSASEQQDDLCNARVGIKSQVSKVFVWDLDETLIIFQTLSSGRYSELYKGLKDSRHGIKLGRQWERLILQVCDEYFFYEQVEDYNEPTLESWRKYDDGADLSKYDFSNDGLNQTHIEFNHRKLAYRHRYIGNLYTQGLGVLMRDEQLEEWQELYEVTNAYTDGWLSAGRTLLEWCLQGNHCSVPRDYMDANLKEDGKNNNQGPLRRGSKHVNVLVTSGTLVPSLVKCLLFQLDKFISYENVFSSREVGKLQCFQWIKERYGNTGTKFCVIGDGLDECEAAQALSWPFIKVETKPDGIHKLPTLSIPVIEQYIRVVYGDSEITERQEV